MNEVPKGRSTRLSVPSATSTWRTVAKHGRAPVKIAVGHFEKEQALDNALNEYCQLRIQDRSVTASQFCSRYPSYRHSLRRLIDVHEALEDQTELDEQQWPELFSEFLGYQILHELGVGAIARVYLAAESALGGRLVAIKVSQQGGDEAETLGKLAHPNIVPVFSVKHDDQSDMTAVCMPYHGSATLADLLEIGFQHGSPPASARTILQAARDREQVVEYVQGATKPGSANRVLLRGSYVDGVVQLGIQMAEALDYTHQRGILHRDLKPSNVLLTPAGVPMLLDFNLASDAEMAGHRLGGTLPYMPPEQIEDVYLRPFESNVEGDPRSDVFSLGVILYELLTGTLPFGDPPAGVPPRTAAEEYLVAQQTPPRSIRTLNPDVGAELANSIHRCLALDPGARPVSAALLAEQLKRYFVVHRRIRRWTGRHRISVITTTVLLLSVVSAGVWHLATRPSYAVRQYIAGVADISSDRYEEAIAHFDQAAKTDDLPVAIRFARGIAYQRLGEHKLAEIDLSEAAKDTNDVLIMECCAYSQMNVWMASPGPRLLARAMYMRMAASGELTAENELNWAFANYDHRPIPPIVIARCDAALGLRPKWWKAYYLRALAHYSIAQQQLKLAPEERNDQQLQQSIQNSKSDFELAIANGPPSAQLFTDAAKAYMLLDSEPLDPRTRALFELAARQGAPQPLLKSLGSKNGWTEEPWFQRVIASCTNHSNAPTEPSYRARFLSAPDKQLVDERLRTFVAKLENDLARQRHS